MAAIVKLSCYFAENQYRENDQSEQQTTEKTIIFRSDTKAGKSFDVLTKDLSNCLQMLRMKCFWIIRSKI